SVLQWLVAVAAYLQGTAAGGPRAVLRSLVAIAYDVLFFALLARVVLSWFGIGRYTRWMRPVYWLTDWLVEPVRRVLPPFGAFDFSPLAALLVLWLLQRILLAIL
ncbi:MAG TPA: YggT family protein, partial [Gemmatimonadales bacterium]|nr:YggT family protein [Gemmatimonadales bacterium]